MKAIKIIGLAALTALTAMAFVGPSSAMAENTTLCSADARACGVTHVHETSVGKAKLLTSLGTTECNTLFLGDVKGETLANPLVLEVKLTYSECKLGSTNCTATEENGPAEIKVLKEGHETATVIYAYLVHLVCGESLDCSYTAASLVGTGKGPLLSTQANGEVTLSEQTLTKEAGGFLCPKSSKLDITLTSLSATYYGSTIPEPTTLCSGDGTGCGVTHIHETSVGKAKLLTNFGTAECEALALGDVKGETLANSLVLEVSLTYSECKLGSTSCTATEENGPAEIKVLKEGHETATVIYAYLVYLVCGESLDCSYTAASLVGTGKGPLLSTQANGEVTLSEQTLTKEAGGFLCPKSSKLDITLTSLSATYISS